MTTGDVLFFPSRGLNQMEEKQSQPEAIGVDIHPWNSSRCLRPGYPLWFVLFWVSTVVPMGTCYKGVNIFKSTCWF